MVPGGFAIPHAPNRGRHAEIAILEQHVTVKNVHLLSAAAPTKFVDLQVRPWHWLVLAAFVVMLIVADLWRHRDDHEPSTREAGLESIFYVAVGLGFAGFIAYVFGIGATTEYLTGYVIEKSLSVDNVFIWAVIFASFGTPLKYQHRVLFWGIFGALVLRGAFVFAGAALIASFWWMLLVFGAILVFSGVRVVRHKDDEGTHSHDRSLRLLSKFMPVSEQLYGHKFITRINGRRMATPLLAALVVVEAADIVFAVDSVPAILAVSREPYIVISANAFAILGLRALYFLLANAKERFHYLSHALGGILVFVGCKMAAAHWYHLPSYASLVVIFTMLILAILFSERKTRQLRAHANLTNRNGLGQ
jgi:tellurite resistance protein TerC